MVSSRSTRSPGKTKPAMPEFTVTVMVTARSPGVSDRGEEAAVARAHQAAVGDGLALAQGRADDGADEIFDLALALDNISRRDPVLGPRLPAQILRPHELAGRQRALGDQHARSHIGHDRRGLDLARRHPGAGDQHRGARNGEGDEHE